MAKHFTHLHVHTDFSLLDGAITLDKLVGFGKQNNLQALCISDHGNVFGGVKFFQQCKKAGIKPILGMEAYLTEDVRIKDAENKYYHLLLVVENATGYKNLCKLISYAYAEGFYFKPRIDYRMLENHHEGLTVTTACLGGHIPSLLMQDQMALVDNKIDWYLKAFGPERFFLEVQPEDQAEQKILNEKIFDLSKRRGIQVVATGDCHYTTAQDREAHEVMLAIQTHHKITDPDRFTFGDCRVHLRTTDEMLAQFPSNNDAIWASGRIADRCTFEFQTGKLFFPNFEIPQEHTQETYFTQLCYQGLHELFAADRIDHAQRTVYEARLQLEIDLIIKMGFIGYFLVVSDFIKWARSQNIPVGPGRGSAAGSLVAWALQITDIDPIKYNLLFERFLNPERVTMPDIDIDFCIDGRDRVINYVREKYGHDKVCQIITFGTMMAKGVIKDVARVLGFPFEDSNALTELIPDQLKITLKEALEQEPKLQELRDSNPRVQKLFDLALRLEGLTRHASKHAAGIVISPAPISEMIPVYVPPKTQDLVTQYAMTE
ncbi:MAG: DNA polymerase III subunit alpha, partial [Candidatus Dependentiae bacterium]|nr:DNA polymerase III subunit alpha [Candidatus Dependentiae bacterium]